MTHCQLWFELSRVLIGPAVWFVRLFDEKRQCKICMESDISVHFTYLGSRPYPTDLNHFGIFGDLTNITKYAKFHIGRSKSFFVRRVHEYRMFTCSHVLMGSQSRS